MKTLRLILCTIFTAASVSKSKASEPTSDLDNIDRTIRKEPKYASNAPGYLLYVLDLKNHTRVWAVLDRSSAKQKEYDVLYFDRNANGDITEPGEKISGKDGLFELGEFVDPNTEDRHTGLRLRLLSSGSVMFGLKWKDKHRVGGGYAVKAGPYTQAGKSPAEAPILRVVAEGRFAFQTWIAPESLQIGSSPDIKFFVGHEGVGQNTFTSVMHPFLPNNVGLEATLVYESSSGETIRLTSTLMSRC